MTSTVIRGNKPKPMFTVQGGLYALGRYAILLIVALLMAFPFIWMLLTTFKSPGYLFSIPPTFVPDKLFQADMFSSYTALFTEYNFLRYIQNSLLVATLASIGQIFTSSLSGFAFARLKFWGNKTLFGILLATALIPIEVTIIPEFLMALRIFEPLYQLFGGKWIDSLNPLIVPSFFVGTTGTFLLREFYNQIPLELEEAAVIDGGTVFQIYRNIYVPLSIPAMTTLFLLAFISNWNALLRAVIYVKSADIRTLPIGLMAFQDEYTAQWDLLLAGSVVTIAPLLIIYIFMQRYIVEGIATTGLKG